jgi:hypothetical protein
MKKIIFISVFLLFGRAFGFCQSFSTVLDETFNDNKSNWEEKTKENGTYDKVISGKYVIDSKYTGQTWFTCINKEIDQTKDFTIETEINCITKSYEGYSNIVSGFGVMWGSKSWNNSYDFIINNVNSTFTLSKWLNNSYNKVVNKTGSNIVKFGSNKIKIVKEKQEVFFFINDQLCYKTAFEKFHGNDIGFIVYGTFKIEIESLKVYYINENFFPPILSTENIEFIEGIKDNRITANENCNISFNITNKGKGSARNLKVLVQNNSSISGLAFSNSKTLGTIAPNATQNVNIPISGTMDLTNGTANIKVSFVESLGFPPDEFDLKIETKEYVKPDVKVVDNSFLTENGTIKLGMPIQLKALIQNVGQGTAENVNVSFSYPSLNVFANGEKDFVIGTLQAGATKELIFEFIANKLYTEKQIPITIRISEKFGKFNQNKQVTATVDAKTSGNAITITSNINDNVVNIQVASLTADVDKNIPHNAIKYPNRYALIIGNEDYSSSQKGLNSEVNVAFATNDAKIFKEYAINTIGIEEKNCFLLINATAGQMSQKIELVTQILSRLSDGELIFYYAGHGFPDETTKIPYLMPVDVSANNLQSAIKLTDIYAKFSQSKAKRITLFLDACFTGGGREQGLLAARGVRIKPKQETVSGNMVVFTATSEDQSALPFKDKQHGIFTYYLLKKFQESKCEITYSELDKYITENVSIESLKLNGKAQDPKVNVSPDAQNTWENWKIK